MAELCACKSLRFCRSSVVHICKSSSTKVRIATYIVDRKVILLYRKNSSASLLCSKFSKNSKLAGAIADGRMVAVLASFWERGPTWFLGDCRLQGTCYNICNIHSQTLNTL